MLPLIFPLYFIRFEVAGFPFTLLELATYVLFLFFIYFELLAYEREKNEWRVFKSFVRYLLNKHGGSYFNNVGIPVVLLLVGATIGVFVAGDMQSALGIYKGWIVAPMLYFIMWSNVNDDKFFLRRSIQFYFLSSFVLAVIALIQVKTGWYLTLDQRASGPFESANYLAMYIAPAFAALTVLLIKKYLKKIKRVGAEIWFLIIEMVAVGLALYFAQSYSAILAVVVAIFAYFLFRYGRALLNYWRRLFITLLIVISLIVGAIYIGQGDTYKFKDFLEFDQQSSSSVRLQVWRVATDFIAQSPIVGIGLGQYELLYAEHAAEILNQEPYEKMMLHAHSLYLSFWLYTGFVGLFALAWLIMSCFVRLKYCEKDMRPYMRLGLVMLVVILVHGVFDTTFWKNDLAYIFWFAVALSRA